MKMDTLFAWLGVKGTIKLFQMYYGLSISESFIICADAQLSHLFRQKTGLEIQNRIRFVIIDKEDGFIYFKGKLSKLSFQLQLPFLGILVVISWGSKSGHIYDISDEDIDCKDIEFSFENLDVELCRKATNPKWSLIPEIYQLDITKRLKKKGIDCSESFIHWMDKQLSAFFEKKTGIKISKRIRMHLDEDNLNLIYNDVSCVNSVLTIIEDKPNNLRICWKSKSGRIYKLNDEPVDCDDIIFWFENFQPEVYIKQYYPNQPLPFKFRNLTYNLVVNRIHIDCTIVVTLKNETTKEAESIVDKIDRFINDFNEKSEEKDRDEGVIHNWNTEIKEDTIIYNLDLGSTGISFFKKLLSFLSKMDKFVRIEIE